MARGAVVVELRSEVLDAGDKVVGLIVVSTRTNEITRITG